MGRVEGTRTGLILGFRSARPTLSTRKGGPSQWATDSHDALDFQRRPGGKTVAREAISLDVTSNYLSIDSACCTVTPLARFFAARFKMTFCAPGSRAGKMGPKNNGGVGIAVAPPPVALQRAPLFFAYFSMSIIFCCVFLGDPSRAARQFATPFPPAIPRDLHSFRRRGSRGETRGGART